MIEAPSSQISSGRRPVLMANSTAVRISGEVSFIQVVQSCGMISGGRSRLGSVGSGSAGTSACPMTKSSPSPAAMAPGRVSAMARMRVSTARTSRQARIRASSLIFPTDSR